MKYALIGCGRISPYHIKAAIESNLDITAVCDVIAERMDESLSKHGINNAAEIQRYTDYKEMLREVNPELVAIATDSGKHASIALDCIATGANIIIEKPIAMSISDADAIIEKSRKKGVKVCVCQQNRFNESMQHLRKAIEQKRFGKLSHGCVHVRWNRSEQYYKRAAWYMLQEEGGGMLVNQAIHAIDMLRWMMGDEIEEVFGYTARQFHAYTQCEDLGLALIRFRGGALGTIEGTTNVYPKNLEETLYIFGEQGTVKAGGKSMNTLEIWQFADERPEDAKLSAGFEEIVANIYGNGHTPLYADMLDAIENNREPYVSAEAGKRAIELVLAIYESAKTGRPVKLPL